MIAIIRIQMEICCQTQARLLTLTPMGFQNLLLPWRGVGFVVCFQYLLPRYILSSLYKLPLGSSRRELHFWTLEYCLLTYSGAMIKNFRGLRPIFALALPFQYLLPRYILSSLQGAPGGSSIFGRWDIGSLYIHVL